MSDMNWDNGQKQRTGLLIDKYPEHCSVEGCANETAVTVAIARRNGRTKGYQPSQVLDFRGDWPASLRDGYDWVVWVARCERCYCRDVGRAKA